MTRWAAVVALCGFAGGVAHARPRITAVNLESLYAKLAPAVVIIAVTGTEGSGLGSGVVLHKKGFIATAAHVVEGATLINVEFLDGSRQMAQIVTLSRTEDLALLKVGTVPKATVAPVLGDSDTLKVGQPIFCVGAPLGLKHTLTTGIISAVRKDWGSQLSVQPKNVIQTDAAINQGNSGGALFNQRGEVIGIASFIATRSGGSNGLGFAVPSNSVRRRLFEEAIPYIGVSLRRIPPPLADVLNWPVDDALLVESVQSGSPAAEAGLRGGFITADLSGVELTMGGDLIIEVNGHPTADAAKIHRFLHGLKAGDKLPYTIVRGGEPMKVEVTVGKLIPIPTLPGGSTKRGKGR